MSAMKHQKMFRNGSKSKKFRKNEFKEKVHPPPTSTRLILQHYILSPEPYALSNPFVATHEPRVLLYYMNLVPKFLYFLHMLQYNSLKYNSLR